MFTKENTKQIKGIAILLMLAHHLFAFPEKVPYGASLQTSFYLSGMELTEILGQFGKICVSLFMFLGGYGLYKRYSERIVQEKEPNQLGKEIVNLYKAYWKVFLIFVPIAFLFFGNQIQYCAEESVCNRFAEWKLITFLMNFVGLSNSFNPEWWFFLSYILALFEGYIFIELFKNKRNPYTEFAFAMLWTILLRVVFPVLPFKEGYEGLWSNFWYTKICLGSEFVVFFFVGIIFAKYAILEQWSVYLKSLQWVEKSLISICLILLSIYVRTFFVPVEFDIIMAPVFVFGCYVFVEQVQLLKRPLSFLSKHSTNMWLTHSFFCYYFSTFSLLIYRSNNAVIAYITLFLLSLASSIAIDFIWSVVGKGYTNLLKGIDRIGIKGEEIGTVSEKGTV